MNKIIKILLLVSFVLLDKTCLAQMNEQSGKNIQRALALYYDTYGRDIFSLPRYKNKAYTFGFAISINQKGKIDTIIFSNKTKALDSLVSFKNIDKELKANQNTFDLKKNTIVVGIVLVRKSWETNIDNLYDNYHRRINPDLADFDQYFYNLIPNIEKISKMKSIRLLPSISLVQMPPKH